MTLVVVGHINCFFLLTDVLHFSSVSLKLVHYYVTCKVNAM